jgi:hypothetical protein
MKTLERLFSQMIILLMGYAELTDQMANSMEQLFKCPFINHIFHNLADLVAQLQTLLD